MARATAATKPKGKTPARSRPTRPATKPDMTKGRYAIAYRKCNPACLAATGPKCECACGGVTHGSDHW